MKDGQRGGLLRHREGDDSSGGGVADGGEGLGEGGRRERARRVRGPRWRAAGSGMSHVQCHRCGPADCSPVAAGGARVTGAAAWARAGGRSHYDNRRKSGLVFNVEHTHTHGVHAA